MTYIDDIMCPYISSGFPEILFDSLLSDITWKCYVTLFITMNKRSWGVPQLLNIIILLVRLAGLEPGTHWLSVRRLTWLDTLKERWPDTSQQNNSKKTYSDIETLQIYLDEYIGMYNNDRIHQGKNCQGRTSMQTFIDGKNLFYEKNLEQRIVTV